MSWGDGRHEPEAQSMRGRVKLRQRKVNVFLLIVGCGLAFFIAEGALRLFFPDYVASAGVERNYFCEFDDEIGWRPLSDISGQHQRHGFSVFVHQNQFGLRGPDTMRREKPSASSRMLILGDSYVWGYGVDQEWVFTEPSVHQSEKELINFGVSGYGTDQEYLFYRREGALFDVDEVMLAFTPYNDVDNNLAPDQYDKSKPYFSLSDHQLVLHTDHVRENTFQSAVDWVWSHSRVVNTLDKAYRSFQNWWFVRNAGEGVVSPKTGILNTATVSSRDREGIQLTMHIIEDLRDAVRSKGARFSVVFIPYKPHILNNISYNHPFVPLLARRLKELNIDYYEPYFIFLQDRGAKNLFNKFDNHFSQTGHALFGKILVDPDLENTTRNLYSFEEKPRRQKESKVSILKTYRRPA
jgi:hypothetical protein